MKKNYTIVMVLLCLLVAFKASAQKQNERLHVMTLRIQQRF